MDVKPMCPYCGEPMRFDRDAAHAWLKCENCLSNSPKIYRPDWNNSEFPFASWSDFWKECRKQAEAAALRRPMQKPLTRAELETLIESGPEIVTYCEARDGDRTFANIWIAYSVIDVIGIEQKENICFESYGKTWRAWAQRPTDKERAAAPWEDAGDADL